MKHEVQRAPEGDIGVMQNHGKSFYFASRLFDEQMMAQVGQLYGFCRYVDDVADETEPENAKLMLREFQKMLSGQPTQHRRFEQLTHQVIGTGVQPAHLKVLIEGALFDVEGGEVHSLDQLLRYCYQVAGVVGLMMCPLIGVKNERAHRAAVSLGVAMQLTNICRDVMEDAKNQRIYLPLDHLNEVRLGDLAEKGETPEEVRQLLSELLALADEFYAKGYSGLSYIPFRARCVIALAGRLYQSIGWKIRRNSFQVHHGRTYLNTFEKFWVLLKSITFFCWPKFWFQTRSSFTLVPVLENMVMGVK